jgi:hypothetical protein
MCVHLAMHIVAVQWQTVFGLDHFWHVVVLHASSVHVHGHMHGHARHGLAQAVGMLV